MIYYLSANRLPTEKANGYQIMKTCEAFSKEKKVKLIYPFRYQASKDLEVSPFEYYQLPPSFELKPIKTFDGIYWTSKLSKSLEPLGFVIHNYIHAFAVRKYIFNTFNNTSAIYYSRDSSIICSLLKIRNKIKGRIFYEAHSFSKKQFDLLRPHLGKLDCLITITHNLKRIFIENGFPERNILVSPDAVDLEDFKVEKDRNKIRSKLELPKDGIIIGYIGKFHTMNMEKGIPELIESLKYLQDIYGLSPYLLCVGGPMERISKYESLIASLNIERKRCIFRERVSNKEVPLYINAADIATIPFPWNDHMAYYTSPMKLFEYMASNTAISASSLPSLREILTDETAAFHKPDDAVDMARCFSGLIFNPEHRIKLVACANQDILKYTWTKRTEKILNSISN